MKKLLLVRHAKSSWKDHGLSDIDRPLNKRGARDAPTLGRRLCDWSLHPEFVISSPAARALATVRAVLTEVGKTVEVVVEDELYGATPQDILDIVSVISDKYHHVMLVCHNPTITEVGNLFATETIDNVPTCGMLVLQTSSWADIASAQLVAFDYPKKHTTD